MKRKLLTFLLAIFFMLPCAFVLSACDEEESTPPTVNTYVLALEAYEGLDEKIESIDVYLDGEKDYSFFYSGINNGSQKNVDEGTEVLIKFTTKQSDKYTIDDVVISELTGKSANQVVEIKQNGVSQNVIEVKIKNIRDDYRFKFDLKDVEDTHKIASIDTEFNYVINYCGTQRLSALEEDFHSIAIWSDKSQNFVSYNDLEKYNDFLSDYNLDTYDSAVAKYNQLKDLTEGQNGYVADLETRYVDPTKVQLGLENIDTSDFKVYVSFGTDVVKFNEEVLDNLVVLRDESGEKTDVSLKLDPMATTKKVVVTEAVGGEPSVTEDVVCYAYTLEKECLASLTENSKIVLNYTNNLQTNTSITNTNYLRELADYYNTFSHRFITYGGNFCTFNHYLTETEFLVCSLQVLSAGNGFNPPNYNPTKKLEEEEKYELWVLGSYIDFSKIDVYLGDPSYGMKLTYCPEDTGYNGASVYEITIPENVYPSQFGNVKEFFFTIVPKVENIDELINTEDYYLVPVVTKVENVLMYESFENGLDENKDYYGSLWRTEISEDEKTKTEYYVIEKEDLQAPDEVNGFVFPFISYINYRIYDTLTLELTFNQKTYSLYFDFKEIFDLSSYHQMIYFKSDVQNYVMHDLPEENDILEEGGIMWGFFDDNIYFEQLIFPDGKDYDNTPIMFNFVSGTVGTSVVKGYSYYGNFDERTEVENDLKITLGNELITPVNGEYTLTRGVTYNFEVSINKNYTSGGYNEIGVSSIIVFLENGLPALPEYYAEVTTYEYNGVVKGTIRITNPASFGDLCDYIGIGIWYFTYTP